MNKRNNDIFLSLGVLQLTSYGPAILIKLHSSLTRLTRIMHISCSVSLQSHSVLIAAVANSQFKKKKKKLFRRLNGIRFLGHGQSLPARGPTNSVVDYVTSLHIVSRALQAGRVIR